MFRIKICGVTRPEDAAHAVACGAEAIGINFFPGSPRFVPTDVASEIVEAVADRAEVVGVFVNESPGTIVALCAQLGIRRVQLHGDEPPGDASRIPLWRMKAVHADRTPDLPALLAYPCEAFLFDAGGKGAYGGTGRELAWGAVPGGRGWTGSGRSAEAVAPCGRAHPLERRARHPRGTPVRSRCRLRRGVVPGKERPGQGENVHRTRESGVPHCRSVRGTGCRIRRATSAPSGEGTSPRR
jgi:phosphoribosylanthranilate isomerase